MTATIEYQGDSGEIVVRAVLRHLESDNFDGRWYVTCTTHDGDSYEGFVADADADSVTLQLVDKDDSTVDRARVILTFVSIQKVVIP